MVFRDFLKDSKKSRRECYKDSGPGSLVPRSGPTVRILGITLLVSLLSYIHFLETHSGITVSTPSTLTGSSSRSLQVEINSSLGDHVPL